MGPVIQQPVIVWCSTLIQGDLNVLRWNSELALFPYPLTYLVFRFHVVELAERGETM